ANGRRESRGYSAASLLGELITQLSTKALDLGVTLSVDTLKFLLGRNEFGLGGGAFLLGFEAAGGEERTLLSMFFCLSEAFLFGFVEKQSRLIERGVLGFEVCCELFQLRPINGRLGRTGLEELLVEGGGGTRFRVCGVSRSGPAQDVEKLHDPLCGDLRCDGLFPLVDGVVAAQPNVMHFV